MYRIKCHGSYAFDCLLNILNRRFFFLPCSSVALVSATVRELIILVTSVFVTKLGLPASSVRRHSESQVFVRKDIPSMTFT